MSMSPACLGSSPLYRTCRTRSVMGSSTPSRRPKLIDCDARHRTLSHHVRLVVELLHRAALGDELPQTAVARVAARAGHDEVAHSCEAHVGQGIRASSGPQSGHLGQSARHERGLGVVPVAKPVAHPGRDGDDVLARPAQLNADDIAVRIHAEEVRHESVLEEPPHALVVGRDHGGRGNALADLLGMVGSGKPGDSRPPAQDVLEYLRHQHQSVLLDALGQYDHGRVRAQSGLHHLGGGANSDAWRHHDDRLSPAQGLFDIGRCFHAFAQDDIGQVERVSVVGVDTLGDLGLSSP